MITADSIRDFTQRDVNRMISCGEQGTRLPEALTMTLPGADRDLMAQYAMALRHEHFGTETFPMFLSSLKSRFTKAKEAFVEGSLEPEHFDALERNINLISQVMLRARTNITDYVTMLFGAMASREKDN